MDEYPPNLPPGSNGEPGRKTGRFQFRLRDLLLLTVASAVILGLANALGGPTLFRAAVAGYFIFLAAYGCLRGPQIVRDCAGYLRRLRELRRQRERWAQEAGEWVRKAREARESNERSP